MISPRWRGTCAPHSALQWYDVKKFDIIHNCIARQTVPNYTKYAYFVQFGTGFVSLYALYMYDKIPVEQTTTELHKNIFCAIRLFLCVSFYRSVGARHLRAALPTELLWLGRLAGCWRKRVLFFRGGVSAVSYCTSAEPYET